MAMIKHVWFDMANTIYKEGPDFTVAHNKHRYATYAMLVGQKDMIKAEQEYEQLYTQYGSNSAVFRALGKPSDFWMKAYEEMDISDFIHVDVDITKTLATIKEQIPISLFTNLRLQKIEATLKQIAVPPEWFTNILSGDDVPERKPALDGFYKMIELSKLPAHEIMYVGDRVDVDIKPAKQVGMKTCLVWADSPEADYCALTFSELYDFIFSFSR